MRRQDYLLLRFTDLCAAKRQNNFGQSLIIPAIVPAWKIHQILSEPNLDKRTWTPFYCYWQPKNSPPFIYHVILIEQKETRLFWTKFDNSCHCASLEPKNMSCRKQKKARCQKQKKAR